MKYYVEERLEEDYGGVVPNAVIYEDFNRFCVANGAAELSQEEIKKSILQECSEAGWKVTNKLDRVNSVPDSIWEYIEKNKLRQERIRCFHEIRILKPKVANPKHQNEATTDLLRNDIKNFVRSHCNSVVENVPAMVEYLNKKYPGL